MIEYISSIIVIILISTKNKYLNNVRLEKNSKILVKYNINANSNGIAQYFFLGIIHIHICFFVAENYWDN